MPLLSPHRVLASLLRTAFVCSSLLGVETATTKAAAPTLVQSGAFAPFMGRWEGALEYRDYQGSGRVKVPVKLKVKLKDGAVASWNFVYDDFGKTVTSFETHSFVGKTYRVVTQGQKEIQSYTCNNFTALFSSGAGKAVLLGSELEDGKPVEVRRTVTLSAGTLSTLKETRPAGGTFAFRNQSTYIRVR